MQQPKSRKKVNGYVIHLDEPLGKGTYGTVYRCVEEASETVYAVKVMEKAQCTDGLSQSVEVST